MNYYVYQYLREDGSPYYIGKGCKNRAFTKQGHTVPLPPKDRIKFISKNLTDEEAKKLEIELIAKYGRKDIGTGILRNMTAGGEGSSNRLATKEMRQKMSNKLKGRKQSEETKQKRAESLRGKTRTNEQRKKQSEAAKKRWANEDLKLKEDRINKIKAARANQVIVTKQVTCPYCGKTGGNRIMPRYHFDNCKFK
jgi:hypothetical protein